MGFQTGHSIQAIFIEFRNRIWTGIGRATALKFVEEGCAVIATDMNAEKLNEFSGVEGITTRRLDVTKEDEIKRLAQEFKVSQ